MNNEIAYFSVRWKTRKLVWSIASSVVRTLGKARSTFRTMWKCKIIGRATKVFNFNVRAVLLYTMWVMWTIAQRTLGRLQVFVNECVRKILNIHWPDRISNSELRKKMELLGHTLRSDNIIAKQALQWTSQGRGGPSNTWKMIWRRKCGRRASGTAGGRWRRRLKTELDGVESRGLWPELHWGDNGHKSVSQVSCKY